MNDIESQFSKLTYKEKIQFYNKHFSSGAFTSGKLDNKIALVSLICLVTKKLREKDGNLTVQTVIEKILQRPLNGVNGLDLYLSGLSIVCEDMLYEVTEINSFGFKESKDIINKIKELLNEWLPF